MKTKKLWMLLSGFGALWIAGCKENAGMYMYEDDAPAVYFYAGTSTYSADSLVHNFVLTPVEQDMDTVYVPLRILGFAADRDRAVNISVADSSTAISGVHYDLGPAVIPAGKYSDSIPVYVYRTAEMQEQRLRLYLRIEPSEDLTTGYDRYLSYKVVVTDQVLPPTWSYTYSSTFGNYSNVKFRFMVSVLQVTSFTGLYPSEIAGMASRVKAALAVYEAENGPLYDENGVRVTFP